MKKTEGKEVEEKPALSLRLETGTIGSALTRPERSPAGGTSSTGEAYLACGVDALFIEALRTPQQTDAACLRFAQRVPLLANRVEGGKTPVQATGELGARGFRIVIFPGGTARAVAHTLAGYCASLRQHGSTTPWCDRVLDFDGLNAAIGTPELLAQGQRYG